MAQFRISGVWKDANSVITDYAVHTVNPNGVTRAGKMAKAQAIRLLEEPENSAVTWMWNYKTAAWSIGENVQVVNNKDGKYLRSDPDNRLTDNLGHLINYDWIIKV